MISISKLMVPLKFPGFLLYVVELARVFMRYVKHLRTLGVGQAVDLQVGTEIAMWGIFAA